eukprot:2303179-Prymnesium_polylepis.2
MAMRPMSRNVYGCSPSALASWRAIAALSSSPTTTQCSARSCRALSCACCCVGVGADTEAGSLAVGDAATDVIGAAAAFRVGAAAAIRVGAAAAFRVGAAAAVAVGAAAAFGVGDFGRHADRADRHWPRRAVRHVHNAGIVRVRTALEACGAIRPQVQVLAIVLARLKGGARRRLE